MCLFPNVTALHIPRVALCSPGAAQGAGESRMQGQGSAGEGTVTWGKDSPLQLADLQGMLCKPLAVAGTFPKAVRAFLSVLDGCKEPDSCRNFQH